MEAKRDLSTLEKLLERKGIVKDAKFGDYQDYIEDKERSGTRVQLIESNRVHSEGSMHLALGRTVSAKKFKY